MSGPVTSGTVRSSPMTASDEIGLVWFRRDLRLHDNPAWAAATSQNRFVVPLFVLDPRLLAKVGPFRRRQLLATLQALDYELAESGGRLLIRRGDATQVVPETAVALSAGALYWNNDVSPFAVTRDAKVEASLHVPVHRSWGTLVHPPGSVLTAKGTLSRVFTPFSKAWAARAWDRWPEPGEATIFDDPGEPMPTLDRPPPLFEGEAEARTRLERFLETVDGYATDRDRPDLDRTSWLSADLKFGTLSPRTVIEVVGEGSPGRAAFVRQLAWRDWYAHLLHELPGLGNHSMRERFDLIEWRNDPGDIAAWKGGFTGFPIVDAGMRQLRETGWMHNRVRMIVASFLVKDLLVDWRVGERHFRHLLVDADLSQNVGNWQWVAGTGPDAAPVPPHLQPDDPEPEVRPGRRLHPALGARARRPGRQGRPRTVGGGAAGARGRRRHPRRRLPPPGGRPRPGPDPGPGGLRVGG